MLKEIFNEKNKEKKLYRMAILVSVLCLLLLFDERWLFSFSLFSDDEKLGELVQFSNAVHSKRSSQYYWKDIDAEKDVFDRESIFTDSASGAQMVFDSGSAVTLGENTLVILSKLVADIQLDLRFGEITVTLKSGAQFSIRRGGDVLRLKASSKGNDSKVRVARDSAGNYGFISDSPGVTLDFKDQKLAMVPDTPYALSREGRLGLLPPVDISAVTPEGAEFYRPEGNEVFQLEWQAKNADQFQVDLCSDPACQSYAFRKNGGGSSSVAIGESLPSQKFYWRVTGKSKNSPLTFSTPPREMMVTTYPMPEILSPGAEGVVLPPLPEESLEPRQQAIHFQWEATYPTQTFEWKLAKDETLKEILKSGSSNEKVLTTDILPLGNYFFRLQATHEDGRLSQTAKRWVEIKVGTEVIPEAPGELKMPAKYKHPVPLDLVRPSGPLVEWAPVANASRYRVEFSKEADFKTSLPLESTESRYEWKKVTSGRWYVRVLALSESGVASAPSPTKSLTVALHSPYLQKMAPIFIPKNNTGAKEPIKKVKVQWTPVNEAAFYELEISEESKPPKREKIKEGASFLYSAQKAGEFSFRVRPMDEKGRPLTDYSQAEKFIYGLRTMIPPPILLAPKDKSKVKIQGKVDDYLWLVWRDSPVTKHFEVQVAERPDFIKTVLEDKVYNPRYPLKQLIRPGTYYWRVRPVLPNKDYVSDWSQPFQFEFESKVLKK